MSIQFDILDLPRQRIAKRRNNIVVVTGDPGSGKSYNSISMAYLLNPDFEPDHITFGFKDFIETFKACRTGKDLLIYEEAGAEFGARDAMSKGNKNFSKMLQVFRFKQIPAIFTLPHLSMIDINGRRLMNYWIHADFVDLVRKQGVARWYVTVPDDWSDDVKRYKVRVVDKETGERVRIDHVRFPAPPKHLIEPYEKMKAEYFEGMMDDILNSMEGKRQKSEPPEPRQMPVPAASNPDAEIQEILGLFRGANP